MFEKRENTKEMVGGADLGAPVPIQGNGAGGIWQSIALGLTEWSHMTRDTRTRRTGLSMLWKSRREHTSSSVTQAHGI